MTQTSAFRRQALAVADLESESRRFQVYTERDLARLPALRGLPAERRFEMQVVASVLPFRVNEYVIEELIDWSRVPEDPIFKLTFPRREMLAPADFERMAALHRRGAERGEIQALARQLRASLNPHPAGQLRLNVRRSDNGERLGGIQHKYDQTVLFFPSQGQTCHSYCTFCFRRDRFVGDKTLRIAFARADALHAHLIAHPEVSDLLITGGDPTVMKTKHLVQYLEPLLGPEFRHVKTIRIGTKALTFWPCGFVGDPDADELIALFQHLVDGGKRLAVMAHYNRWLEFGTDIARRAIARVRSTGAEIRSQGPLLGRINDDASDWARRWQEQMELGIIPYYMFLERDTGARSHFEVPLARAWDVYRGALQRVSGLGRTARGPSMSAGPGKVELRGVAELCGGKVFALRFIQGRNADWVQRPFFAAYGENATWLDQLRPAFGEREFFFEPEYRAIQRTRRPG